ncbi:MAG: GPP34 family phosphoprotein [Planctomycetes bacterium]|nr:GPP34 family phosphoprotein [Planctomycetota bacterium]
MPQRQAPLYLHEEIMLLALRDEEGTVGMGSMHVYAIGGAILAELLLDERIAVDEGRRRLVNLQSSEPLGEPILDEALQKISAAKRRAPLATWVQRLAGIKRIHHRVARGLCRRGILRTNEKTFLLLFRRQVYPELDPRPERRLIERLREAIFGDNPRVQPRTVILIALAQSVDLLRIPFSRKDLRRRKPRIRQLCQGELMGRATAEAVHAAQVTLMMTAIMPSVVATAVATR